LSRSANADGRHEREKNNASGESRRGAMLLEAGGHIPEQVRQRIFLETMTF
jgi:hypothetical protein